MSFPGAGEDLAEGLRREHPSYEPRPEQDRMARDLAEALEHGGVLLAEAPTGLGKTLAYLVPAVEWSRAHGAPVVVATHTRNLQDQILDTEWPIVERVVGGEVRVARLKGRENYLCRSRVEAYLAENAGTAEANALEELLDVVPEGDLSAAGERAGAMDLLRGADLGAGHCPSEVCRNTPRCWLRKARRRAAEAHVVVTNHALWLTDHLSGGGVLPEFTRLVVDEAHHLPDAFTRALSTRFTEGGFHASLDRLLGRGRAAGVLPDYARARRALPIFDAGEPLPADELSRALERVRGAGTAAFEALSARVAGRGKVRIDTEPDPAALFPPELDALLQAAGEALSRAAAVRESPPSEDEKEALRLWPYLLRSLGQWEASAKALRELTGAIAPGRCATLERDRSHGVTLESVPWDVGGEARAELTARLEAVVLTSATLSAGGTFDYLCERLGLSPGEVQAEAYRSPLDAGSQLLALTVKSLPDPRQPEWIGEVAEVVTALARLRRNMLVLATSWDALRKLEVALDGRVDGLLVQGDPRGRTRLTGRFRRSRGGVLLAVQSFWEGVDFPGEELEILVMLKLPFGVPTDPVFAARKQDLESRGLDAFRSLALPEALLRFRQGLGRLLRRSTDRGVFVLLDRRAIATGYGKEFVRAIGSPLVTAGGAAEAEGLSRAFFGEETG